MQSLRIGLPLVDGGHHALEYSSGKQLIHDWISDDWGAPPRSLTIEARTRDGQSVEIVIPYDDSDSAVAFIRDAE